MDLKNRYSQWLSQRVDSNFTFGWDIELAYKQQMIVLAKQEKIPEVEVKEFDESLHLDRCNSVASVMNENLNEREKHNKSYWCQQDNTNGLAVLRLHKNDDTKEEHKKSVLINERYRYIKTRFSTSK